MKNIQMKKKVLLEGLKVFCSVLLIFSVVYYIKDNIRKRDEVTHIIHDLMTSWNNQDMERVSMISQKNEFVFTTGFENNIDISKIINNHIFGEVEYDLLSMKIVGLGQDNSLAQATIHLKTYNNLEVLDTIIEQLLKDTSEVTMEYNHEDFINQNIESIKEAVQGIQKDSEKTVIIYLEQKEKQWIIPYENNEEFYNSLSGNLITFNKEVEPEVEL